MKTKVINTDDIKRQWFVIDATNQVLGRLATQVGRILTGKNKPQFSPNQDHGDFVIVINSDKIQVTGNKAEQKMYFRHSMQPGGGKFRSFKEQMALDSTKTITKAIHGMVPKNALGRAVLRKLYTYKGDQHPHAAQKPTVLSLLKSK